MVRLEPFATLSIQLQGGRFDHADRMFGDIGSTWNGVLEDMSDVKELVCAVCFPSRCEIEKRLAILILKDGVRCSSSIFDKGAMLVLSS